MVQCAYENNLDKKGSRLPFYIRRLFFKRDQINAKQKGT